MPQAVRLPVGLAHVPSGDERDAQAGERAGPTSAVRAPRFSATQPMMGAMNGTLPMKTIT